MDITWESIFRILAVGMGTYIFLPLLLIIRDMLLWKVITTCLLSKKLRESIKQYALLVHRWNTKYTVKAKHDGSGYFLGEEQITKAQFSEYLEHMDTTSDKINELDLYIQLKSGVSV